MKLDIVITPLEIHPDDAHMVSKWIMTEWGRLPIHDYFEIIGRGQAWHEQLPRTIVAHCQGELVGTSSVLLNDLETRLEFNPWFGCLYVAPTWRRRGIGTRLLIAGEAMAAKELGIDEIYLFTEDQETLYAKFGWVKIEDDEYHGKPIVIMRKQLNFKNPKSGYRLSNERKG